MSDISALVRDLVVANRILARENVVDAYGQVSVRHPDNPHRFLLATSIAPEMVKEDHIVEFNLDCTPVRDDGRPLYHVGLSTAVFLRPGRMSRPSSMPTRRTCCRSGSPKRRRVR